jgi:hypothetical protein
MDERLDSEVKAPLKAVEGQVGKRRRRRQYDPENEPVQFDDKTTPSMCVDAGNYKQLTFIAP